MIRFFVRDDSPMEGIFRKWGDAIDCPITAIFETRRRVRYVMRTYAIRFPFGKFLTNVPPSGMY